MALEEYRRKRDFAKTSEPKGASKPPKPRQTRSFVIQKHAASHLHYDFRLELDGVLKSWAVPKGPSLDPKVKRLAIEVEDHPLDYASFEGTIPAGEYGAGTVIVWDQGEWEPIDERQPPEQQLANGELKVMLQGTKLQGGFVLVRTRTVGGKPQWLLIKERDDQARPEDEYIVTEAAPDSAVSGRSLEQVAAGRRARPEKGAQAGGTAGQGRSKGMRRNTATPGEYLPALATLVEKAPAGEEWIHEIKFDGYRLMGHGHDGEVRLLTRNQLDWTARFPNIAQALGKATSKSFVIDGELVALDEQGISSFKLLQSVLKKGETSELVYYAFDLLELDGEDLRPLPLLERKARLEKLIVKLRSKLIRSTEHIANHGPAMFQECCRMGLEGIVSKRAQGRYPTGRSLEWLKTKCIQREEFVIGGFTAAKGERSGFGALLLGQYSPNQELIYAGRVGAGFTDAVLRDLGRALRGRTQSDSPFANLARRGAGAGVTFVKPELVCQVEFATWTADGLLRHASFLGLREDRPAAEVHHPIAVPPPKAADAPHTSERNSSIASKPLRTATASSRASEPERPRRAKSQHQPLQIEGVTLTHPERLVYPEQEVTKRQLAEHLALVADWMLPHIAQRPLSLLRCPDGTAGACFYQKHAGESMPDDLGRVLIAEKSRSIEYVYVKTVHDLVSLAQMNVLEIHPWGARIDRLEQADRLIFDLDPDEAVEWKQIIAAAHEVRAVLSEAGLDSYVKTTGGKGLHVVAPIQRRARWPEIKRFCKELAQALAAHSPKRYTTNISKAARVGKILIDYLRNDRGSTAVAPYSPRARSSAGVATPVTWEELDDLKAADQWTILSFPKRLARLKRDPWSGMLKSRQQLRRALVPG